MREDFVDWGDCDEWDYLVTDTKIEVIQDLRREGWTDTKIIDAQVILGYPLHRAKDLISHANTRSSPIVVAPGSQALRAGSEPPAVPDAMVLTALAAYFADGRAQLGDFAIEDIDGMRDALAAVIPLTRA
ncbi:hypothetical protein GCM10029978_067320 [Actinoallomurus acanthiterrae]